MWPRGTGSAGRKRDQEAAEFTHQRRKGFVMADARQALEEFLDALGESSQFATSGSLTPVIPGLEVKGVGSIGTPISAADAKRLIATATQAPYGRGEETIVDTSVRRVWQLEPSQFSLRNAQWSAHVAAIVDVVRQEFGIRPKVNPQLYKLLIYEKGSFFAPHRDTEKTPGMFATLVVCLPSRHEGGTLIVRHESRTTKIEFGGKDSEFKTQYAAFYADCRHEITPVTAGYRVCLVYNLATAGKKQPSVPQNAAAVEQAAQWLGELFAEASRSKIAVPFQHQYTEAGLDPKGLKGSDRTRFDVLARAADKLDYQCYLALLTHHQSGEVDYDTWDFGGSRRRWSRWSYDEEEDDDRDDSGAEMGEVYEEDLWLDHWLNARGRKQPFGKFHLAESEILTQEGKEGWCIRQEVHEATGNEGVSMERWYRQGVVVIWPRDRIFSILAGEGQVSALPELERRAARSKKPAALAACRTFAEAIIDHWHPRQRIAGGDTSYSGRMLAVLERIGTADLAQRFVRDVLPKDFDGSEGKALHRLGRQLGWEPFATELRTLIAHQKPEDYFTGLKPIVSLCEPICCDPPALTEERRAVCTALADELAKAIERWDKKPTAAWHAREETRAGVVEGVVRMFAAIAAKEHLDRFLAHVLEDKRHYDLQKVLVPDVKAIYQWLPKVPEAHAAASLLLQHCLVELRAATAEPIEPPKDWTREAKLGCTCEDCQALRKFLRDPSQQVARFSIRKERRRHLHQQIDSHQCDCTHVTDRKGSPQTLVCTKTQGSYERRLKQYHIDRELLAELEAIAGSEHSRSARVRRPSGRRMTKR
jgi:hypothetical protein